ncbi:1-aminocyclopropane-1-carboxylate deaminase/D-cysteine desulfhydrase [Dyadobacter tibetensis]|uniref:1-aminocyclopropane-1-carboxylate deaminase/D-cysteine desulfhydrase n=1 Tax=Dyadobacter tibetensis TaxID=1211851 RepID=UPI00046EEACC|nr:pyridoxal-phosphate dependent enzyme [Dyadobacter tibetensis]
MDLLSGALPSPLVPLKDSWTQDAGISLYMKRDDLIHPLVSGNKWRKLKYALADVHRSGNATILSFGGAYSNHLYALAAAGRLTGISTIGIVRGEELAGKKRSDTLAFCEAQGMKLHFVSRESYRLRYNRDYLESLSRQFGKPYIIPEGGTSTMALEGVGELAQEVYDQLGRHPDYYTVPVGSGGTTAGLLSAGQQVLAFPVLKNGGFLKEVILDLASDHSAHLALSLFTDYHFGGYGKWNPELVRFILDFRDRFQIPLEQIYTGKMMYGLYDLMSKGFFRPGTTVVALHTGGLQGLDVALR